MKILVVDDKQENIYLLEALLKGIGYDVISACNGVEALEKIRAEGCEMIISDILMPIMDGFQFCREVKCVENLQKIPFIFYTAAYTDENDEQFAFESGADKFIRKPIAPAEFIKIVRDIASEVEEGRFGVKKPDLEKDKKGFEYYSERMVKKLEKKMKELEEEITERKRVEEALRESEEKYRKLIETSPDGIAICTLNARFLDANHALQEMLGYTMEELKDMSYKNVLKKQWHEMEEELIHLIEEKGHFGPLEMECIKKDGTEVPVTTTGWLIRDSQGTPEKLGTLVKDITDQKMAWEERKKLETRLQQAQKMEAIGTLAGGIAHDFNNILGVIMGYAEMVELFDIPENSPSRSKLDEIIKATHRAKDLVHQILTFSRETEHTMKPVQLSPLVKETLKFLRASLPTTIEIRPQIESDSTVLADPTQIHQILMNLCTNAGYAMRESGGVLEVGINDVDLVTQDAGQPVDLEQGLYVRIKVRDTGHGMSSVVMERIFDPYFTTKKLGDGTGLGLSVVHGIVKSHGGAITVDSELGRGTSFTVFLPRLATEAIECEVNQALPFPSGNERILFVDDEKTLVDIAKTILDGLGYETVGKEGGLEALETFRSEPDRFDLVITDQTMPKMTGIELARELMTIRPEIPVILCSGFSQTVTTDKAKAAGIREFIKKPLVAHNLVENIRKVLDKS